MLRVDQLTVYPYIEDPPSSLDELRIDPGFLLDRGRQTGGLGKVVSLDAVLDADVHGLPLVALGKWLVEFDPVPVWVTNPGKPAKGLVLSFQRLNAVPGQMGQE